MTKLFGHLISLATLALLLSPIGSLAQTSRVSGSIEGEVEDRTGGLVSDARITVRNLETGQLRVTASGADGSFRLGEIAPGGYAIRVEAPGFAPYMNDAIFISIGATSRVHVQLSLAAASEEITVSDQPAAIDTGQTVVATTIDTERIEESPVVTRDYLHFALLAPGVSFSNQASQGPASALPDSGFTFAGLRPRSNSLYIDGVENNDEFWGGVRTELSLEAVREFQVVNNGSSAELGGGAGGTINVVTKSGVNIMHGDAFLFVQNGRLNAKEPLTNETSSPDLNRMRAGLALGGPIIPNRTFYYFAGEQERSKGEDSSNISQSIALSINSLLATGLFPRLATRQLNVGTFRTERAETEASGKLNHQINQQHSLLVKYAFTNNREVGDGFKVGGLIDGSGRGSSFIEDHGLIGSLTSVLSLFWVNDLRLQASTRRAVLRTVDQIGPEITIAGLINFGRPYEGNSFRRENHYQIVDVATVSRRRHLIRLGVDVDRIQERTFVPDGFGGVYIFPTLSSFLNGEPDQYRQAFGDPRAYYAVTKYAGFLQDHWTATDHLTVDMGLRYDFEKLPPLFHQDTNNFGPRVGIAFSPAKDWVLRGAFGIFFDRYVLAGLNRVVNGQSVFEQVADQQLAAEIFLNSAGGRAPAPWSAIKPSIFSEDSHLGTPYSEIGSVGIEHLVSKNLTTSATYLFARGVKLPRTRNTNLPIPLRLTEQNAASLGITNLTLQALGRQFFSAARLDGRFNDIYQLEDAAGSAYHGLSLSLNRRLANEIEFAASYTFSKALDDASDFAEQPENPYFPPLDRARSLNDQRHRFVFSGLFELPWGDEAGGKRHQADLITLGDEEAGEERHPGIGAKILGNVEIAPIFSITSGSPVNPVVGIDANRSHAFPVNSRPLNLGRDSLSTPAQVTLDLRILKFFRVRERGKLDLVAESFNLLNHKNAIELNPVFGTGSTAIPSYGMPERAASSRQVQFSIDFEF
jgi:hypothetical protein